MDLGWYSRLGLEDSDLDSVETNEKVMILLRLLTSN